MRAHLTASGANLRGLFYIMLRCFANSVAENMIFIDLFD